MAGVRVWCACCASAISTALTQAAKPAATGGRLDEVLVGPTGRTLLVSTDPDRAGEGTGLRRMGTIPWSPRTPIVLIG